MKQIFVQSANQLAHITHILPGITPAPEDTKSVQSELLKNVNVACGGIANQLILQLQAL